MGQLEQMFSQPDYSKMGFFEKLGHTWPARTLQELFSAAKLPGEVYAGQRQVFDPQTGHVSQDVIQRSADLAGGVTLGAGALPAQKNSLRMGIKAYHGSPHDFDKFSMDKIGTGEGAQAYGHGLYFAENEGVARSYRDALTIPNDYVDGELIDIYNPKHFLARTISDESGNLENATEQLKFMAARGGSNSIRETAKSALEMLNKGELPKVNSIKPKGSMYEVDINANPDDFLDWDAPLSAQPKGAQQALQKFAKEIPNFEENLVAQKIGGEWHLYGEETGTHARQMGKFQSREEADAAARKLLDPLQDQNMRRIMQSEPYHKDKFAKAMAENNVPGIKYKDAGSRGMDGDSGSRNYVVFDDKLISIVKKYGIAGAIGMGLMTQEQGKAYAAQEQAQQQNDSLGDILANALKGRL